MSDSLIGRLLMDERIVALLRIASRCCASSTTLRKVPNLADLKVRSS